MQPPVPARAFGQHGPDLAPRFALRMPGCARVTELVEFAARVEQTPFDALLMPDSQFVGREVWTTMALTAARTSRLRFGPAVTNFESRHVTTTAASATTVSEIAPGRLILGVGTGDSAVKMLGFSPTRLARMREEIDRLRGLLAGEAVRFGDPARGWADRLLRLAYASAPPPPIHVAATGARALALAGEMADGVIVLAGTSRGSVERALGHVADGAARAGRTLDDIEIWLAAHTAFVEDEAAGIRAVKPLVVSSAQLGGGDALRRIGIELEVPNVMPEVYPDMPHAESWDDAIAAAERWVSDEMAARYAEHYAFVGTPETVTGRIAEAAKLGVSGFYVMGFSSYELPETLLSTFADQVIPRLRARSASGATG